MDQTNTQVLREDRAHGSLAFPCALYCNQGRGDSLTVKHHWQWKQLQKSKNKVSRQQKN